MNEIALSYGRGHLDITLPPGARPAVIRKQALPKLADPKAAIRGALDNPIASAPLAELARERRSACILICDITRPVPNRLFLRPMIETMVASGIAREKISVLVATGLHRPNLGDELAELENGDAGERVFGCWCATHGNPTPQKLRSSCPDLFPASTSSL